MIQHRHYDHMTYRDKSEELMKTNQIWRNAVQIEAQNGSIFRQSHHWKTMTDLCLATSSGAQQCEPCDLLERSIFTMIRSFKIFLSVKRVYFLKAYNRQPLVVISH